MNLTEVLKIFLPKEVAENFDLVDAKELETTNEVTELHLHLDEKFVYPNNHSAETLESKGFQKTVSICDFPIQGNRTILKIRKRRWVDKKNNKVISKRYDFKHKGTNYSKKLAAFLKE